MNLLTYLNHKPAIGVISGFSSGVLLSVQSFITDETVLKVVAALGVWLGAIVAGLTVILKIVDGINKLYIKLKK